MKVTVTKTFHFSACHSTGKRILGKNYVLEITLTAIPQAEETVFEKKVHECLIAFLESRDLGLDVDFLKGIELTDKQMLEIFWRRAREAAPGIELRSMTLQRDAVTKTTLIP